MINTRKIWGGGTAFTVLLTAYRKEARRFNLVSFKTSERRSEVG